MSPALAGKFFAMEPPGKPTHSFFKRRLGTCCVSGPVGSLAWLRAGNWSQVPLGEAGSSEGEDCGWWQPWKQIPGRSTPKMHELLKGPPLPWWLMLQVTPD